MKELKEFSYYEVLNFNKKRLDYIKILHSRVTAYYLYLNLLSKKNIPIPPADVLKRFSQIDDEHPLIMLDIKEN